MYHVCVAIITATIIILCFRTQLSCDRNGSSLVEIGSGKYGLQDGLLAISICMVDRKIYEYAL